MDIVTVGIDLAKNVFALHGVDQSGKAVFIKPKVAHYVAAGYLDLPGRTILQATHFLELFCMLAVGRK